MFTAVRPLAVGADAVVTVMVVMAARLLVRDADALVEEEVSSAAGTSTLRSAVKCSGTSVEER